MAFHVPELARLSEAQHATHGSDASWGNNGAFLIDSPEPGWRLFLIASDGMGWEHVSISARRAGNGQPRTPTWKEMSYVKRLCWDAEDVVVQFHPRESEYVNCHPNVLHLWRSIDREFPTPLPIMVGPLADVQTPHTEAARSPERAKEQR